MIDAAALRFPFSTAAAMESEDAVEDFGDFPVNCGHCHTPVFPDETVPGHGWCGLDTEQDSMIE